MKQQNTFAYGHQSSSNERCNNHLLAKPSCDLYRRVQIFYKIYNPLSEINNLIDLYSSSAIAISGRSVSTSGLPVQISDKRPTYSSSSSFNFTSTIRVLVVRRSSIPRRHPPDAPSFGSCRCGRSIPRPVTFILRIILLYVTNVIVLSSGCGIHFSDSSQTFLTTHLSSRQIVLALGTQSTRSASFLTTS